MILCLFVGAVESGGEERSGERVQSFCSRLLRVHTELLYESGDHKLIILLPLPQSVSPLDGAGDFETVYVQETMVAKV